MWLELAPIEDPEIPPGVALDRINRRIRTHLAYRRAVDEKKVMGTRFYRADEAHNVALRRELFIRRDAAALLRQYKKDATQHESAFNAIDHELTARGGHQVGS